MPLSAEEKRQYVLALGKDPSKFTVDDDTVEVVPVNQAPTVTQAPAPQPIVSSKPPEKQYGLGETIARNAATGILPALAGAGAWAGASAFAPETLGLSFLIPLAASLGASALANWEQNTLAKSFKPTREFMESAEASAAQNPKAAAIGKLASSLPVMRPSVSMIKDAAQGALAGNIVRNPALQNVALGATLPLGFEAYNYAKTGQKPDLGRLAIDVAGGALMNKPANNPIARSVGLHPYVKDPLALRPEGILSDPSGPIPLEEPIELGPPDTLHPRKTIDESEGVYKANYPYRVSAKAEELAAKELGLTPKEQRQSSTEPVVKTAGEGSGIPTKKITPSEEQDVPIMVGKYPMIKRPSRVQQTQNPEGIIYLDPKTFFRAKPTASEMQGPNNIIPLDMPPVNVKPAAKTEDIVPPTKISAKPSRKVGEDDLDAFLEANPKFVNKKSAQETEQARTEQAHENEDAIDQAALLESNKQLASKLGAGFEVLPKEQRTIETPEGKKAYGIADIGQGKATITQTKPDTGFHELTGHLLFENLPEKLQNRYLKGVTRSKRFSEWAAENKYDPNSPDTAKEFLAQGVGEHDLKRIASGDNSLIRDITSWLRTTTGIKVTAEDAVRQLANRAYYGKSGTVKPLGAEAGVKTANQPATEEVNAKKELPADTTITVQKSEDLGNGEVMPGYEQFDLYDKEGKNIRSTNAKKLREEGYTNVPSDEEIAALAQGQHKLGDIGGLKELPEGSYELKGRQEGYGKIPATDLYNITAEGIHPKLPKGTTVTERGLKEAGFKLPKEKVMAQGEKQTEVFPRGKPEYVGNEVGQPLHNEAGFEELGPSDKSIKGSIYKNEFTHKYYPSTKNVTRGKVEKLLTSIDPEDVNHYQQLYKKALTGELTFSEDLELRQLHEKYSELADLNTPIFEQINKSPKPKEGEVVPDVSRNQSEDQTPVGKTDEQPENFPTKFFRDLKDKLSKRDLFKMTSAQSAADTGYGLKGSFTQFGERKVIRAEKGDTETALHEAVHSITRDNAKELHTHIGELINKGELKAKDLLDLSKLFRTISGYKHHQVEVGHAAFDLADKGKIDRSAITNVSRAMDELLSQATVRDFWKYGPDTTEKADRLLNKVFGKDIADFVREGHITKEEFYPKYDKEKEKFYQPEEQSKVGDLSETDTTKKGFFRPLEASFDAVERVSKPLAQAFRNWEARRDQHLGTGNAALKDLSGYDTADVKDVVNKHDAFFRGDTDIEPKFTGDKADISNIFKDYYGHIADIRREAGMTINNREAGKNPYYIPHQLNERTIDLFVNKTRTVDARAAARKWAKYMVERAAKLNPTAKEPLTFEKAMGMVNDYINALGSESHSYKKVNFGAIRKAEGYGLPTELREADPLRSLSRYSRRAAADLAMFQELESKPEIAAALKLEDPRTGKIPDAPEGMDIEMIDAADEVKKAMKWVKNDFVGGRNDSPLLTAFVRNVNNALLGTATGVRDTASILNNALPYVHNVEGAHAVIKGLSNFQKHFRTALETGAYQPNIDKRAFNDLLDSPNRAVTLLRKSADLLRKYQGREAIEEFNRVVTFSIGRELASVYSQAAKRGDKLAQDFVKKFSTLVEGDVTKLTGKELDKALNQMAKNFVDRNQGTYGGRGLSSNVMEGSFAPFVALQKWSIEKSNVIYKDVFKPFMNGSNRLPMLTYTLGSVLTGVAIQQLNKLMTNRRPNEADLKEALTSGDPKQIAAEVATLMQLGSYAGIIGDIGKATTDYALKGKTPRNIVSFPTATAAADLSDKVANVSEALQQGDNPWEVFKQFALDLFTHNVQAVRMLNNHVFNREEAERSDKFRDVRVFRELQGEPNGTPSKANPYLNMEAKTFKRTSDLSEAAAQLPALLEKFKDKVQKNPDKAMSFLKGLKSNNYQTMPNMENSPIEFAQYYNFLKETQGEEEARKRVTDYIKQNALNKAKSEMIP